MPEVTRAGTVIPRSCWGSAGPVRSSPPLSVHGLCQICATRLGIPGSQLVTVESADVRTPHSIAPRDAARKAQIRPTTTGNTISPWDPVDPSDLPVGSETALGVQA